MLSPRSSVVRRASSFGIESDDGEDWTPRAAGAAQGGSSASRHQARPINESSKIQRVEQLATTDAEFPSVESLITSHDWANSPLGERSSKSEVE